VADIVGKGRGNKMGSPLYFSNYPLSLPPTMPTTQNGMTEKLNTFQPNGLSNNTGWFTQTMQG